MFGMHLYCGELNNGMVYIHVPVVEMSLYYSSYHKFSLLCDVNSILLVTCNRSGYSIDSLAN